MAWEEPEEEPKSRRADDGVAGELSEVVEGTGEGTSVPVVGVEGEEGVGLRYVKGEGCWWAVIGYTGAVYRASGDGRFEAAEELIRVLYGRLDERIVGGGTGTQSSFHPVVLW